MMLPVKFLPAAERDVSDAIDWYKAIDERLGQSFRDSIGSAIETIRRQPMAFPVVHGPNVRCALTAKFPYLVIFLVESDRIIVVSVFHTRRNPVTWKERI